MFTSRRPTTWFNDLSVIRQSCLIVTVAVIGADLLTLIFYSIFFADRLLLDLTLTSIIVIAVASPLSYFFMARSAAFAALAEELDRANRLDDLTQVLNRKSFLSEAAWLIKTQVGNAGVGTVLFIDADHFKKVNDTFGHGKGDAVLCELGAVLRSCTRKGDLVGRLGGEEFAVFIAGAGHDRAAQVCERIHQRVKDIARSTGLGPHRITVSIGVSVHRPGQNLDMLLSAADRNLYAAKESGRDRTVQSDPELTAA